MKGKRSKKAQIILQNLLKEKRKIRNISQREMAKLVSFPQPTISKYESGERKLDLIELIEVCHALNIKLSDFVLEFEKRVIESQET